MTSDNMTNAGKIGEGNLFDWLRINLGAGSRDDDDLKMIALILQSKNILSYWKGAAEQCAAVKTDLLLIIVPPHHWRKLLPLTANILALYGHRLIVVRLPPTILFDGFKIFGVAESYKKRIEN